MPFGCCALEVFNKQYNPHLRVLGLHHFRDIHIARFPQVELSSQRLKAVGVKWGEAQSMAGLLNSTSNKSA